MTIDAIGYKVLTLFGREIAARLWLVAFDTSSGEQRHVSSFIHVGIVQSMQVISVCLKHSLIESRLS